MQGEVSLDRAVSEICSELIWVTKTLVVQQFIFGEQDYWRPFYPLFHVNWANVISYAWSVTIACTLVVGPKLRFFTKEEVIVLVGECIASILLITATNNTYCVDTVSDKCEEEEIRRCRFLEDCHFDRIFIID